MLVRRELENGPWRHCNRWPGKRSLALVAALLVAEPVVAADSANSCMGEPRQESIAALKVLLGDKVHLEVDAGVPPHLMEEAVGYWRRCPGYGSTFPAFVTDAPGGRSLRVRYVPGTSGSLVCGRFKGRNVTLYGMALQARRLVPCGDPSRVLAHELGHALGLADAPDIRKCHRYLMSRFYHSSAAPAVQDEECGQVDRRWVTPNEPEEFERMTGLGPRDRVRTADSHSTLPPGSEQTENSEGD